MRKHLVKHGMYLQVYCTVSDSLKARSPAAAAADLITLLHEQQTKSTLFDSVM